MDVVRRSSKLEYKTTENKTWPDENGETNPEKVAETPWFYSLLSSFFLF